MFDETNQADLDLNSSEESFDESVFEEEIGGEEGTEEDKENEEGSCEVPESETEEESYTVKYNGKEVKLTLDELKTNAQKGLNYDHVKSEMDDMKNTSVFKEIADMAKKEGVSLSEYCRRLDEYRSEKRFGELIESGMDKKNAEKFIKLEQEISRRDDEARESRPYIEFARRFPEVEPSDIADEVWERFNQSGDLIGAYIEHENAKLKEKIAAYEQNEKNRKNRVGSLKNNGAQKEYDAFLEGLFEN